MVLLVLEVINAKKAVHILQLKKPWVVAVVHATTPMVHVTTPIAGTPMGLRALTQIR